MWPVNPAILLGKNVGPMPMLGLRPMLNLSHLTSVFRIWFYQTRFFVMLFYPFMLVVIDKFISTEECVS